VRIDCAVYVDGSRREFDPDTMSIDDPIVDGGFVWLGLRVPDEAELQRGLTALAITGVSPLEVLTPHRRPVLTVEGSTVQIVLRTASYEDRDETIALGEMTLLVTANAVITIRHGQASQLASLRSSLESDPSRLGLGPTAVVAAVIGLVIDDYGPALDGFENDVVEVERDVFSGTHRQPVQRLYKLKREVRRMLVAIDALDDPLARLIRVRGSQLHPEVLADLNEAEDQLDRAVTRAHSLSGLLDAALTASLTQITVRQNDDMRKISAWVAMAAVPTMIAGIYGMNFEDMPELGWKFGYPTVATLTALAVALLYRQFKKSGWL
jgi:magnesium transporter